MQSWSSGSALQNAVHRAVLAVLFVLLPLVDSTAARVVHPLAKLTPYEQFRCLLLDAAPKTQQHKTVLALFGFNGTPPICHIDVGTYVFNALINSRERITAPPSAIVPDTGATSWMKTLPSWVSFRVDADEENSRLSLVDFLSGISLEQHSAFFALRICGLDNYFLGKRRKRKTTPPRRATARRKEEFEEWLDIETIRRAREVRTEMEHVWYTFRPFYAAPEMNPETSFAEIEKWASAPMMLCDSLSTLAMLGMEGELQRAVHWLDAHGVGGIGTSSVFEFNIRVLGGLLSTYYLTDGKYPSLLVHAEALAQKILVSAPPTANTTQIIYPRFSLQGQELGLPLIYQTNLAECGTLQLEFHSLSQATGNKSYYQRIKRNMVDLFGAMGRWGIPPHVIDVRNRTKVVMGQARLIGPGADSYFEYLLKEWIMTGKKDKLPIEKFRHFIQEIPGMTICTKNGGLNCGAALGPSCNEGEAFTGLQFEAQAPFAWNNTGGMRSVCVAGELVDGGHVVAYDHLSCFFPGLLALLLMQDQDPLPFPELGQKRFRQTMLDYAVRMLDACLATTFTTETGAGWETAKLSSSKMLLDNEMYHLRPEIVESLFYMWRLTKEEKYRNFTWRIFVAIRKYLKRDFGYSVAENANKVPPAPGNGTETFVLSETFKYMWFIFSDDTELDLNKWVLNTEAHPLPIMTNTTKITTL